MNGQSGSSFTLAFRLLALVSLMVLGGCGSVRPSYDVGVGGHARVARDSHYNPANFKPYTVRGQTYYPKVPEAGAQFTGIASWYGRESPNLHTANGEIFDTDNIISAAHKTFPLPSIVEVTNLDNGKTIRVRVNDRGPFVGDRLIDLSKAAARALGSYSSGTARVRVTWLGPADRISSTPGTYAAAKPVDQGDGSNRYIVQLGAFSQRDNAEKAQARMDEARLDRKGSLYLVFLGPYSDAAAAEKHRQDALDEGFSSAILKRYE